LILKTDSIVNEIYLKPDEALKHFRGIIPFGLAVSPDEKKLFVAEAGINAIGVIDHSFVYGGRSYSHRMVSLQT
jgi:DNA-binding beta-propeller fold protein YncE